VEKKRKWGGEPETDLGISMKGLKSERRISYSDKQRDQQKRNDAGKHTVAQEYGRSITQEK